MDFTFFFFTNSKICNDNVLYKRPASPGLEQKDPVHLYHTAADLLVSGDPHPPGFNIENNIKHHKNLYKHLYTNNIYRGYVTIGSYNIYIYTGHNTAPEGALLYYIVLF